VLADLDQRDAMAQAHFERASIMFSWDGFAHVSEDNITIDPPDKFKLAILRPGQDKMVMGAPKIEAS
jgi:hypothetical protein